MLNILFSVAAVLSAALLWIYSKLKFNSHYWKNKGVAQLDPVFIYGTTMLQGTDKSNGGRNAYFYNELKKRGVKHGGYYMGKQPCWMPVDPELIKNVLIKDFQYFSGHHPVPMKTIFYDNLFHMDGPEWKDMRRKLTPTFTSGKMKMMYEIVLEKTIGLQRLVDNMIEKGESTEIKELLARYTTDVIGNCGFGVECNSMEDEGSEFFRHGQMIFEEVNRKRSKIRGYLAMLGLVRHRRMNIKPVEDFFSDVVKQNLDYREENKIVRKDFMHLMIQLKNKGVVTEMTNDNEDVFQKTVDKEGISFHHISAEALLFFTAGFETSSTTMSFALLELTQYQDVQKKIREEVREVLKKHNGKMTYEALQEMTYLENAIQETLRKYPPVPIIPRKCTQTYKIPGTNVVIEKGTSVVISDWGLHMDPEYFPNPEKFIPERFSAENKRNIKEMTYMPFGEGPRQCLGLRFGMMQSKAGIASLINKFNFTLNEKTPYPPEFSSTAFMLTVEGGIYVDATRVD